MTEQQTQIQPNQDAEDEIDILMLIKILWSGRKTLWISLLIGTVLGVFVAIFSTNEYTATTVMVPQMGSKGQSQLGGLAALAGVDLGGINQTNELSPVLYPKITNSIPFKLELMYSPIKFNKFDQAISLFDFYTKYNKPSILVVLKRYTIGLPSLLIEAFKTKPEKLELPKGSNNQPILLSEAQYGISKILDGVISLDVDKKDGFLTLTVQMPEALAAAQIAKKSQELLQRNITNFKIEKAKADLDFIQGRYNVAKADLEKIQVSLAMKSDRNKNLISGLSQVETNRTQTQFNIAYSIFLELAKQLEQAKIQVKKDTPVFTIVEPVSVPYEKSKPNRPIILIIWICLSGIIGAGIIFGKHYFKEIKQKWNE